MPVLSNLKSSYLISQLVGFKTGNVLGDECDKHTSIGQSITGLYNTFRFDAFPGGLPNIGLMNSTDIVMHKRSASLT